MLLVVFGHVAFFTKSSDLMWADIFAEFRMPLFFFVSGFVFYKATRTWNLSEIVGFFKKKLPIQLVFPFICLCLYLAIYQFYGLDRALFQSSKAGYWFTFVLLEYYVFYILFAALLPFKGRVEDIAFILYGLFFYVGVICLEHILKDWDDGTIYGLLSMPHWKHFLFFVLGTLVRKHFSRFVQLIDNDIVVISCIAVFVGANILGRFYTACSLSGVLLIFAFFRRYQESFTHEKRLGRTLQYVGRRTLDIYLLHYFFLVMNDCSVLSPYLTKMPVLGLFCELAFSVLIIALCLLFSNILRLSPFIAHYFLGAKIKR